MAGIGGYMSGGGILGGYMSGGPTGLLGGGQAAPYASFGEWAKANPDTVSALAMGLLSGPTFRDSLANASAGYAKAVPMDRRRQAVNTWLKAGGPIDIQNPATAALFQDAPDLAEKYIASKIGGGDIRRSLNPLYLRDANGNLVVGQMNDAGAIETPALPPGMSVAPPTTYLDTGTGFTPASKYGGVSAPGPVVPKNVFGEKKAAEEGAAAGKLAAALPAATAATERIRASIKKVLADPYLPRMTGWIEGRLPNVSEEAANIQSELDLIQGGTFLQAYNDLRGAGQITEKEGEAAMSAYNRLKTMTMSDANYAKALREFDAELGKLLDVAGRRAAATTPYSEPAAAPPANAAPAAPAAAAPSSGDGWTDLGNGVKIREKP